MRNNLNNNMKVSAKKLRKNLNKGRNKISQLRTSHSNRSGVRNISNRCNCDCGPGEYCAPCVAGTPGGGLHIPSMPHPYFVVMTNIVCSVKVGLQGLKI